MIRVILDTNSVLHSVRSKINFHALLEERYGPVDLFIFPQTLKELDKLDETAKGQFKRDIKLFRKIIDVETKEIDFEWDKGNYVDEIILNYIETLSRDQKELTVIFTQDKKLAKNVLEKRVRACFVSARKQLKEYNQL